MRVRGQPVLTTGATVTSDNMLCVAAAATSHNECLSSVQCPLPQRPNRSPPFVAHDRHDLAYAKRDLMTRSTSNDHLYSPKIAGVINIAAHASL